ncbi:MAG: histidine ammonia-lyase [Proteobacteria bacterium]|nr:histidine ammonia-lyase [Pseudomonadota bacterium]
MKKILLGNNGFTLENLVAISRHKTAIGLTENARKRIRKARELVDSWVREGKTIYGITTGFGALSNVAISRKDTRLLQENILKSHAAGTGNNLPEDVVRAMMALRIKDLAKGHSGIRLETVDTLIDVLNSDIIPVVPEKGSVGASGDLVPLAHMALVLIGLGEACYKQKKLSGADALKKKGISPLTLDAAEGLALINGTQAMTAVGALAVNDARNLLKTIDISAAMSLEVLMGSNTEFDPRIHKVRPYPGQAASADNMRRITDGSGIISSHKDCKRVQDAYTLRCSPQVHGASRDATAYAENVISIEMNAATNNPLIFSESDTFLLGGNFHGQPVALAMDFLCMAVAELANISERRVERLVNPLLSGLPAFLTSDGGLNSGFMIAQYTAAALVSENKVLCHPACVDSIPTSANKEDHVSMGTISARKAAEIVKNAEHVIAIELLCAAQGIDLFTNAKPGKGVQAAYQTIRKHIPYLDKDRILSTDIQCMVQLIKNGEVLKSVEEAVGELR